MKGPIKNQLDVDGLDAIKEAADERISDQFAGKDLSARVGDDMLALRRAYAEYRLGFYDRSRDEVSTLAHRLKNDMGEHAGAEAAREIYKAVDAAIDNALGVARA